MPDIDLGVLVHGVRISRNAGFDDMLIRTETGIIGGPDRFGTSFSTNRSLNVSSGATMMTKLKLLGAAVILAAVAAAPTLAQAHRHHRHHHHHHRYHHYHHHWISYVHNYGPGALPGTYAYYDGPTWVRCKQSAAAYRGQDSRRHPCF
jgi:hypothetical protein